MSSGASSNRRRKRGISEIVAVMAMLLIAVVAVFALRGWISSQQSRLTSLDMATATYSSEVGTGGQYIISLDVRNSLPNQLTVQNITVVLGDGTVKYARDLSGLSPTVPSTVGAKSDQLFVFTVSPASGSTVKQVSVLVQDSSSGQMQWISAMGG